MTKDPAVLLYTADFITGTLTMTDAQRGRYILLLCLQHQQGMLHEREMLKICGEYDEIIWSKFEKEGEYYVNRRMQIESEKRRKYCESRRGNRSITQDENIRSSYDTSYDSHKVNVNKNKNKSFLKNPLRTRTRTRIPIHTRTRTRTRTPKQVVDKQKIPDYQKFLQYALSIHPDINQDAVEAKYITWVGNKWKDGYDNPIKNWMNKLRTAMVYMPKEKKQLWKHKEVNKSYKRKTIKEGEEYGED